jgi:hypothetical protein
MKVRWNVTDILDMYYDWDKEREVLNNIQKCQRNWDYSKFIFQKSIIKKW